MLYAPCAFLLPATRQGQPPFPTVFFSIPNRITHATVRFHSLERSFVKRGFGHGPIIRDKTNFSRLPQSRQRG